MALAGRSAEFDQLHRALSLSLEGRPQLVKVTGPAGIGKTALMESFSKHIECQGHAAVLWSRMLGPESADPYRPVVELIADLLNSTPEEPDTKFGKFRNMLSQRNLNVVGEVMGAVPGLAVPVAAYKVWLLLREGSDEDANHRLGRYENNRVALLTDLICSSKRRPIVICLDDVQWIDSGTAEVFSSVFHRLENARSAAPVFIVQTVRQSDSERQHFARLHASALRHLSSNLKELSLSPVARDALPDVAAEILGQPIEPHPHLYQWLYHISEGNPLRLRGVLATMQDWELLVDARGALRLTELDFSSGVPDPLRRVEKALESGGSATSSELSSIPAGLRRFLEASAIWGREFPIGPVVEMAALSESESIEILRSGLKRGLLREGRPMQLAGTLEPVATMTSNAHRRWLLSEIPHATKTRYHFLASAWWRERLAEFRMALEIAQEQIPHTELADQLTPMRRGFIAAAQAAARHLARAGKQMDAVELLVEAEHTIFETTIVGNRSEESDLEQHERQSVHLLLDFSDFVDRALTTLASELTWLPEYNAATRAESRHHLLLAKMWRDLEWYSRSLENLDKALALSDFVNETDRLRLHLAECSIHAFRGNQKDQRAAAQKILHFLPIESAETAKTLAKEWYTWTGTVVAPNILRDLSKFQHVLTQEQCLDLLAFRLEEIWSRDFPIPQDEMRDMFKAAGDERPTFLKLVEVVQNWTELTGHNEGEIEELLFSDFLVGEVTEIASCMDEFVRRGASVLNRVDIASIKVWIYQRIRDLHQTVSYFEKHIDELVYTMDEDLIDARDSLSKSSIGPSELRKRYNELAELLNELPTHGELRFTIVADELTPEAQAHRLTRDVLNINDPCAADTALAYVQRDDATLENTESVMAELFEIMAEGEAAFLYLCWARIADKNGDTSFAVELYQKALESHPVPEYVKYDSLDGLLELGYEARLPSTEFENEPTPMDPMAAEDAAERAIESARRAGDIDVSVKFFNLAFRHYDAVADGLTRQDDICEMKAGVLERELFVALDGEPSEEVVYDLTDRVVESLETAVKINQELGDLGRVYEILSRLLEFELSYAYLLADERDPLQTFERILNLARETHQFEWLEFAIEDLEEDLALSLESGAVEADEVAHVYALLDNARAYL